MSDRLLGVACLATAGGMAWAAQGYAAEISYEPVGPRAFPMLLAVLLAIGGAWLVLKPTLTGGSLKDVPLGPTAWAVGAVAAYALLFERLGFPLATTLMAVPLGMAFGGTWKASLAGGAGLGLGCWFLFDKLLDVVLPTGVLSFILGGR
jgi:putative tricarboxylic transport membrane protein